LKYSDRDSWHRGNYKTTSNSVAAFNEYGEQVGIVFETATPFDTPRLMDELLSWFHHSEAEEELHPLIRIALFIVIFLEIHPFQDGNGRLSRVITTLLLLQAGYAYVPYTSLESVIEQSKEGYYLALRQTQGTIRTDSPNWQPWLLFFVRVLEQQMYRLKAKVERENLLASRLPELSMQILEYAREHGRVRISDMVTVTQTSRNTLKEHFRALTKEGFLILHGSGRGAWYQLGPDRGAA
jgi:Fic family protein